MKDSVQDINRELMLDANAAAGILIDIFGSEMTVQLTECAHCGHEGSIGSLLAFTHGPGIVLRCSECENVMIRIVQTADEMYFDARGAVYLRIKSHNQNNS